VKGLNVIHEEEGSALDFNKRSTSTKKRFQKDTSPHLNEKASAL
jgi:hypothetical protein